MNKQLYPEQQKAREMINRNLNRKIDSVYVAPCGTGKTFTSASVIKDRNSLGNMVYVLVSQIEIMTQWQDELFEQGLNPGYINDEGIRGKNRSVYVCMYQSLSNIIHVIPESIWPDEIIIDECQHSPSNTIKSIIDFFKKCNNVSLLGLTATLYHGSGASFESFYQEIIQTITKPEAIEKGYITQPIPIVPDDLLRDFDIPVVGDDFDTEKQAGLLGDVQIIGNVIDTYEITFTGKPVLVACATYEHARLMTESFNNAGWKFEHIHSGLQKHVRKRMLKDVAEQKINGLCTVGIGIEGLSINGLFGVFFLRRTMSPIIWTQFNGRAERLYPGKKYAFIVDFVGNTFIHGMPDKERTWTLEGGTPEDDTDKTTMQVCPYCGVMNAKVNEICHFCGKSIVDDDADKKRKEGGRKLPIMVDGELVAITKEGMENVRIHVDDVKAEIVTGDEESETARQVRELKELTTQEKGDKLREKGIFNGKRRGMFVESLKYFS